MDIHKSPRKNEPISDKFISAQKFYFTKIRVISGCFEAPLQLIYQVWLINIGVLNINFNTVQKVRMTDMYGNIINVPYTLSLSIVLSMMSILTGSIHKLRNVRIN